MDPILIRHLSQLTFPIISKYNHNFYTKNPDYNLVIVGGTALNACLRKQYPTKDMDLKLVYNRKIEPEQFLEMFSEFNRIRANIILEIKHTLNNYVAQNPDLFGYLEPDAKGNIFRSSIMFYRPFYFDNIPNEMFYYRANKTTDKKKLAEEFPLLTEVVFSISYKFRGFRYDCSLIDLTMFTNLRSKNLRDEPGVLVDNELYLDCYQMAEDSVRKGIAKSINVIPHINHKISQDPLVFVKYATLGFLFYDLYILKFKHHIERKRMNIKKRLAYVKRQLEKDYPKSKKKFENIARNMLRNPFKDENIRYKNAVMAAANEFNTMQITGVLNTYGHTVNYPELKGTLFVPEDPSITSEPGEGTPASSAAASSASEPYNPYNSPDDDESSLDYESDREYPYDNTDKCIGSSQMSWLDQWDANFKDIEPVSFSGPNRGYGPGRGRGYGPGRGRGHETGRGRGHEPGT